MTQADTLRAAQRDVAARGHRGLKFYETERGQKLLVLKREMGLRLNSYYRGSFVWRRDHWEYAPPGEG